MATENGLGNAAEDPYISDWAEIVRAAIQTAGQSSPKTSREIVMQLEIALSAMAERSPESTGESNSAAGDHKSSRRATLDATRRAD